MMAQGKNKDLTGWDIGLAIWDSLAAPLSRGASARADGLALPTMQ